MYGREVALMGRLTGKSNYRLEKLNIQINKKVAIWQQKDYTYLSIT